jgi:hypothetical protein
MKPTKVEVGHYVQLVGKTVKEIQWQEYEGEALPILVFTDGSNAAVMRDPEGNGVGFLDIEERQRTSAPCPECGRHEDGKWFTPCPSDDCPSHKL